MPGGNNQPSTTQSTKVELSPEQKSLFDVAFPYAQQYASTPIQQYQGSGIAPLSANETQAQQGYLNVAAPAGADLAAKSATAQSTLLDPTKMLDVANNPYLQNAMQANSDIVNRALLEQQLPAVAQGATQAGGMYSGGSSREGIAQGQAIGRANATLGETNAGMLMDAYKTGLSTMSSAVPNTSVVQAQQLFAPDVQAAVGGQERALEQAKLDEQIQKFYTSQSLPFIQAQELMQLLNGMPGATTTSTATGTVPQASPIMSGLGGAASGASIGSVIPGVGTGIGAAAGLLAGILGRR